MGKGVPREDIYQVADALLTAGERPTVERVRLALGRGSPNTIGPLLDGWWGDLSKRLAERVSLPGLPDAVTTAFADAWKVALAAGQTHAERLVAPERAALAEVMCRVEAAAIGKQATLTALANELQQSVAAQRGVEAALAISEQRAAELRADLAAGTLQHQSLIRQTEAVQAQLAQAATEAERERRAHATERDRLQDLLRQVEDRAYGEVDRTRQELKASKALLAAQTQTQATALRISEQARRGAETTLGQVQRENAALRTKLARAVAASTTKTKAKKAART